MKSNDEKNESSYAKIGTAILGMFIGGIAGNKFGQKIRNDSAEPSDNTTFLSTCAGIIAGGVAGAKGFDALSSLNSANLQNQKSANNSIPTNITQSNFFTNNAFVPPPSKFSPKNP